MPELWFSLFDFTFNYKGTEPAFIEAENTGWAKEFAENTSLIEKELEEYLVKNNLPSYFNTTMVSKQGTWKTIALRTWEVELYKNQKQFPFTSSLLKKYPEILSASFSLLEPHSAIVPHCGDTNAIYRCHLGLQIPAELPDCGLRVREEKRGWKKGKWLIFLDAYNHEAWNNTGKQRYIMIVDVLRNEFTKEKRKVTSTVMTSMFLQRRVDKLGLSKKTLSFPGTVKFVGKSLRPFASAAITLVNKLKVY
jgi:aspartyl/asparaginyl beta-hydroxylase (cupin superfamily)